MNYRYRARSQGGDIISGSMEAIDEKSVVSELRRKGFLPISIEQEKEKLRESSKKSSGEGMLVRLKRISTVSLRDKAVFFTQLSTMIGAGVSIGEALNILSGQTKNPRLSYAIKEIKKSVDGGVSLSRSMRNFSVFSPMSVSIVQAGEEGGTLDESLAQVADFFERQDNLKKKIVSATSYPAVVMAFSMFVLYLLITVVIPKFSSVFKNLNVDLPWTTRKMFALGNWMADNYILFLGSVLLVVISLLALCRMKASKPYMDRFRLKMPIFGDLLFKAGMARSTRTLASLTHSGIPILTALDMTSKVADNYVFEMSFKTLELAARKGAGLGATASGIKLFPPMVAHMMRVGEETGQLDDMLDKVADWFEFELDEKIKRLSSVLEPVMIIFVGGIVAMVALAIFSPIVSAIQGML